MQLVSHQQNSLNENNMVNKQITKQFFFSLKHFFAVVVVFCSSVMSPMLEAHDIEQHVGMSGKGGNVQGREAFSRRQP
jgi:hypothetical protein